MSCGIDLYVLFVCARKYLTTNLADPAFEVHAGRSICWPTNRRHPNLELITNETWGRPPKESRRRPPPKRSQCTAATPPQCTPIAGRASPSRSAAAGGPTSRSGQTCAGPRSMGAHAMKVARPGSPTMCCGGNATAADMGNLVFTPTCQGRNRALPCNVLPTQAGAMW